MDDLHRLWSRLRHPHHEQQEERRKPIDAKGVVERDRDPVHPVLENERVDGWCRHGDDIEPVGHVQSELTPWSQFQFPGVELSTRYA